MGTRYTYLERRSGDLHVVVEWDSSESGIYPAGPRRLVIELTRPVPAGITAETMRRAVRHLGDMTDEFNEVLTVGGHATMVRQYVEERLATLPPDGDAYHRGLLAIVDDLVSRGESSPENVLANAMRVPLETMNACLKVARQRLGRESA
ncbi:hypothetical protein [Actinoplanes sp. OR16]|uniref:hypothetical protein n=1 Tax=Actinoplanes sp. OR16 TaxID=946334 RepID=UPI000FD77F4C|nr:hypothetical protein [Actinoplanes sp. OR16]